MRILRLLISAFLFFAVISLGGFFLTRELLLFWGKSNIRNSLKSLNLARTAGSYTAQCLDLGANIVTGEQIATYQIRFISSSEYRVEVVCEGFLYEPIVISQETLPNFVTKVPGTSGLFSSPTRQSGIDLTVFSEEIKKLTESTGFDFSLLSRHEPIIVENGVIIADVDIPLTVGSGPVTICQGYGYECCNEISHFGVGDKITGLTDCQQSCYSSCATRPVLLTFNTNPVLDPATRTVQVTSGSPVEFTFVADFGKATSISGILDFGDGTKAPVSGLAGQTAHTYECASARCSYTAKITLEDNWGVKSADVALSKITIVVTR